MIDEEQKLKQNYSEAREEYRKVKRSREEAIKAATKEISDKWNDGYVKAYNASKAAEKALDDCQAAKRREKPEKEEKFPVGTLMIKWDFEKNSYNNRNLYKTGKTGVIRIWDEIG